MIDLAFALAVCVWLILLVRLIGLQRKIRNLQRSLDLADRRYLAQFTREVQAAEREFINTLRRARGEPPL